MTFFSDLAKTLNYAGRNGLRETMVAASERLRSRAGAHYVYRAPSDADLDLQRTAYRARREAGEELPLISFLVPVYEPNLHYLEAMLRSCLDNTYQNFEIVVADASPEDAGEKLAESFSTDKISWHRLPKNLGISGNTNAAAEFARGDYVALLDYDDLITQDALFEITSVISEFSPEIIYTDEDKCDEKAEKFFEPNHKPGFNVDYFFANNYICHLLVMKRELFLALKLRSTYDGAQDYDLMLRAPWSEIRHVPKVLYHWRTHQGSTAGNPGSKDYAYEAGLLALKEHFRSCRIDADVIHSRHRGFYDVTYQPDIFTARKEVGVVGGKLVDRNHRIVGGMMDEAGRVAFAGMHEMESGPMHRADTMQDVAAVDVRCMQIRDELRPVYQAVFNASYETHIMKAGEDELRIMSLEFCRQARNMGYLIVWDPRMSRRME
ncbi:Glycosyl transferase family 2 [Lachnospiraceae bacterium NK3A20]|nr:Glycosyl transferase family 2 [Lachnospiraceae bacterium NK3A20]